MLHNYLKYPNPLNIFSSIMLSMCNGETSPGVTRQVATWSPGLMLCRPISRGQTRCVRWHSHPRRRMIPRMIDLAWYEHLCYLLIPLLISVHQFSGGAIPDGKGGWAILYTGVQKLPTVSTPTSDGYIKADVYHRPGVFHTSSTPRMSCSPRRVITARPGTSVIAAQSSPHPQIIGTSLDGVTRWLCMKQTCSVRLYLPRTGLVPRTSRLARA
jgi:hypothetical protein